MAAADDPALSAGTPPQPAAPTHSRSDSQDTSLEERVAEYYSGETRHSHSRERSVDSRSIESLELAPDSVGLGLQARTPVTENDPLGALALGGGQSPALAVPRSEASSRRPSGTLSTSVASSQQSRKASLFKVGLWLR